MASKRNNDTPRRPPATTPEARENQLVSLAIDMVEDQLRNGTAPTGVVTHYLKLGSTRERLEQERLISENELLKARVSELESKKRIEDLFDEALSAMRRYSGNPDPQDENYDD